MHRGGDERQELVKKLGGFREAREEQEGEEGEGEGPLWIVIIFMLLVPDVPY